MLMRPFCGILLNKVCYKMVMKYAEKKVEGIMGVRGGGCGGGGMKR